MKRGMIYLPLLLLTPALSAATAMFDGAVTYQVIDGFGVNANHRSWNNDELKPVLDALIDEAGMTLFRVVYDNSDWETSNDDADSNVMNWSYYSSLYGSGEFGKMWDLVAYLNSKGITTNGVMFNFMGWAPAWMGGSDYRLTAGMEDEWAEMITSLLVYARNTKGLQFQLVAPDNEPDLTIEGIRVPTANQYTNALHKLAVKLEANGLADVRFVAPDCASGDTAYMPGMMADPVIMAKLAHFGVHSYSEGGGSGVYDYIHNSAYTNRNFWMTEYAVMCSVCDAGQRGTYDWNYCRGTARYLLSDLANNTSAGVVWEGYDSYYLHSANWSFHGLISVDDEHAAIKTYTPRKNFYTVAQISKWVRPGAQRIGVSGAASPFSPLLAFKHTDMGQITIVGINTSAGAATLSGTLASLPAAPHLDLYYTSATTNLAFGGSVTVNSGVFNATIPADCVFTLAYGLSQIAVTPNNASVVSGYSQQFAAEARDTLGHVLDPQPTFSWSATGGGTIDSTGIFTAASFGAGRFNVIATSGGVGGTATVTVRTIAPLLVFTNLGNGSYLLRSEGIPGHLYRFEYTDALTNPVWQSLGSGTADALGVVEYTDSLLPNPPARYYRSVGF